MPRLFIAIAMPDDVRDALEDLTIGLPAIRWTPYDQFHLTLRFIGDVETSLYYDIGEHLADITFQPFDLALQGIGQFPPRGEPRTLWVGIAKNDPLGRLKRRIDRKLEELGLEPERRKFTPHVTIGRFQDIPPTYRFAAWLHGRALFRTNSFTVQSFGLYSSHLRPEGADHQLEATYDFVNGIAERV